MTDETSELLNLARDLASRADRHPGAFHALIDIFSAKIAGVRSPIESERAAEDFTRSLRRLWLEASASSAGRSYRSPPVTQTTKTATGRDVEFGYERDLQPTHLETRCKKFFGSAPKGWTSDHILLSSGQSAMAAVLHALEGGTLFGGKEKLSFAHLGSYFETTQIFSLFSSLLRPVGRGRDAVLAMDRLDADVFIVEPVFYDGEFGTVDVQRLIDAHRKSWARPRVYLFDATLLGSGYPLENSLDRLRPPDPPTVFRIISGMKLLQGGFELSSVGILSIFTPEDGAVAAHELGDRIRSIRTLLGSGLSFTEVGALEAPWFLDSAYTDSYQAAIFENNERLARSVSAENRLFSGVFHPSLLAEGNRNVAPFCAFRLREHDGDGYAALEDYLKRETERRGIQFDNGGSFGFRGHRFEVVRPDDAEPFLRVALGRRTGWSCDQTIALMTEIAGHTSVRTLARV